MEVTAKSYKSPSLIGFLDGYKKHIASFVTLHVINVVVTVSTVLTALKLIIVHFKRISLSEINYVISSDKVIQFYI